MPSSGSLWSGRDPHDDSDHHWIEVAEPVRRPPAPPPPPPPRDRTRAMRRALAVAAGTALLAMGALLGVTLLDDEPAPPQQSSLPVSSGRLPANRVNEIYDQVGEGVVSVQVARGGSAASGTGFVVDADGTVVTNAHVVGDAEQAQVRFDDTGRAVPARVLGTDPSSDLAVLNVDRSSAPGLRVLPLADSDKVRVGDTAIAIGYPLGLDRTATAGIVSGLGREIRAPNGFTIDEVIQTDAPINPGNSGGPLIDASGRVIGVNSQIATAGSQGNVGIGFAVPSNTVREVVPKLKGGLSIERPYLGVSTAPALNGRGAAVRQVTPGGPADEAGIRASSSLLSEDGDVIVSIEGRGVTEPDDVAQAIEGKHPGDRVRVRVLRDGVEKEITVTLGRRPARVP
ncbi:MAG TPA: trypsin-like peptidase domain-containing protein [Solirubrobacteraceae bacterium]|jgi:putative serine protease PepD|nr:trypsin-like peptidase domain-containing protein [Solirubrobacteraceae bacterium]